MQVKLKPYFTDFFHLGFLLSNRFLSRQLPSKSGHFLFQGICSAGQTPPLKQIDSAAYVSGHSPDAERVSHRCGYLCHNRAEHENGNRH
jgi:hypothetical protein